MAWQHNKEKLEAIAEEFDLIIVEHKIAREKRYVVYTSDAKHRVTDVRATQDGVESLENRIEGILRTKGLLSKKA